MNILSRISADFFLFYRLPFACIQRFLPWCSYFSLIWESAPTVRDPYILLWPMARHYAQNERPHRLSADQNLGPVFGLDNSFEPSPSTCVSRGASDAHSSSEGGGVVECSKSHFDMRSGYPSCVQGIYICCFCKRLCKEFVFDESLSSSEFITLRFINHNLWVFSHIMRILIIANRFFGNIYDGLYPNKS